MLYPYRITLYTYYNIKLREKLTEKVRAPGEPLAIGRKVHWARGGEGAPIWSGWGCLSEILHLTPKRDQSGHSRSLCRPLKETSLHELSKYKESKLYLFCYRYFFACNP